MRLTPYMPTLAGLVLLAAAIMPAYAGKDKLKFDDIPLPRGADVLIPTAANASGWITGYYRDTPGMLKAFLLRGNRFTDMSFPSTTSYTIEASYPVGMTRNGLVAGLAFETAGPLHSYTRMGNTITELIYPNSIANSTQIVSMSSDGKIFGQALENPTFALIYFIYKDGVFTPRSLPANPPIPAQNMTWISVNSSGHLLGSGEDTNGQRKLFVAKRNHYQVLPAVPGNVFTSPITLLDSGDVVAETADLDSLPDPFLGTLWTGSILKNGVWQQISAPQDTKGITHFTGATLINNGNFLILGTYNVDDTFLPKPFSVTSKGCDKD